MERLTLEQDPRTAMFVRKIIKRSVKRVLKKQFPDIDAEITGEAALVEGATSAVTVRVDSQLQLMFKFDLDTAAKEIEGYQIMEQALPRHTLKPFAYDGDAGWLCIPYLSSARNLHDIIRDAILSETDILTLYADFLRQMLALWIGTYSSKMPDENQFIRRLHSRTKRAEDLFVSSISGQELGFSQLLRAPLRVNGVDYPPIIDLLDLAIRLIIENPASCSVTAHRDEHAKNILVETASVGGRPQWYLVDLPNVSTEADWAWSIAKMRHWWLAYYYIDQVKRIWSPDPWLDEAKVHFESNQRKVWIEYEIDDRIPPLCQTLDRKVEYLAQQMGEVMKDSGWVKRYAASLFLVFYGGIPYHHDCQHVIPILLGESAKALRPVLGGAG